MASDLAPLLPGGRVRHPAQQHRLREGHLRSPRGRRGSGGGGWGRLARPAAARQIAVRLVPHVCELHLAPRPQAHALQDREHADRAAPGDEHAGAERREIQEGLARNAREASDHGDGQVEGEADPQSAEVRGEELRAEEEDAGGQHGQDEAGAQGGGGHGDWETPWVGPQQGEQRHAGDGPSGGAEEGDGARPEVVGRGGQGQAGKQGRQLGAHGHGVCAGLGHAPRLQEVAAPDVAAVEHRAPADAGQVAEDHSSEVAPEEPPERGAALRADVRLATGPLVSLDPSSLPVVRGAWAPAPAQLQEGLGLEDPGAAPECQQPQGQGRQEGQ
eukprot:CAMPEP_0175760204 /NCGR_PEP_ID=MMETSP0097-20121207/65983_1 /TAXON_ID=311494 /ORGANISM="Alexandrium monilatum, Strain CCMP3105" /LENGTH=329 /DNA_ID=CAMNT_0017069659 /DNA_START=303 /DNA_END=1289 /DNA_ORIENTATION=+